MPRLAAKKIELFSCWTFFSVIACCFSVSYMAYIATRVWLISFAAFFLLFLFLYLVQILLITSTFIEIQTSPGKVEKWRPTKTRIIIFIIIGLLFSQPLIFLYKDSISDVNQKINSSALKEMQRNVEDRINTYVAEKKLTIFQKKNILSQINEDQMNDLAYQNRKKALIIFNEGSENLQGSVTKNLENSGFQVTKYFKVDKENLNLFFDLYKRSLNPGDVSIIYYVGKYNISNNKVFLLPIDSQEKGQQDLQSFTSSLIQVKPFASIYFLYLIDEADKPVSLFDFNIKAPSSSIFFIAKGSNDLNEIKLLNSSFIKTILSDERVDKSLALLNDDLSKQDKNKTLLIDNLKQNSFYIRNPKKHKVLTDEELYNILPAEEYCSNFISLKNKKYLRSCLDYQINSIQRGIVFFEDLKAAEKEKIKKLMEYKRKNSFKLLTYFSDVSENKLEHFLYIIFAVIFISGGFILRDVSANCVDTYEQLSYKSNRINVLSDFRRFRSYAKSLRLHLTRGNEKVTLLSFPHPFKAKENKDLVINDSADAADMFYKNLKSQLENTLA